MTHRITVLSKEGCHLCENVIEMLLEFSTGDNFDLKIIDISKDTALFEKYFLKIPVVQLDGRDVFEAEQVALRDDCRKNISKLVANLY